MSKPRFVLIELQVWDQTDDALILVDSDEVTDEERPLLLDAVAEFLDCHVHICTEDHDPDAITSIGGMGPDGVSHVQQYRGDTRLGPCSCGLWHDQRDEPEAHNCLRPENCLEDHD